MLTYTDTLNSTQTPFPFKTFDCADYTDCVIKIKGTWSGTIEFYGDNTAATGSSDLLAVQSISGTNWTTAVTSEVGSSPSSEHQIFRVPVAGLTYIGIYGDIYSSPAFVSVGDVDLTVTFVSNSNAR